MRVFLPAMLVSMAGLVSFTVIRQSSSVTWTTFQELNALATSKKWEKEKRPIIVDLYTNWCGWCKRMDAATYENEEVANYINSKYYAVKFNAEQRDSVVFGGQTYKFIVTNQMKDANGNIVRETGTHELAYVLGNSNGRMGYPTTVFLDDSLRLLQALPGYLGPDQMMPILQYFGEGHYKTTPWEKYQQSLSDPMKNGTIGD